MLTKANRTLSVRQKMIKSDRKLIKSMRDKSKTRARTEMVKIKTNLPARNL